MSYAGSWFEKLQVLAVRLQTMQIPGAFISRPPSSRLRRWGTLSWSLIGVAAVVAGALWVLIQIREVFPPLILAIVTIYLLNPLVSRLENRGINRLLGSCLGFLVLVGVLTLGIFLLVPLVVDQSTSFARDFPETVEKVAAYAQRFSDSIAGRFGTEFDLREAFGSGSGLISGGLGSVGRFIKGAVHIVVVIVIGPIIGFYLLVDLPRIRKAALRLFPPRRRPEVVKVAAEVGRAMGGFFRGQLLVAFLVGVLSAIGLRIIGLQYWLVIGLIAGLFNMIPLIGPYIGAIPGVLVAATSGRPVLIGLVVIVLTVVQQIDNHFISPNVMRWTVRLHPVSVIVSLIVGATLAGIFGMLLAVPTFASLKVILGHFWYTRVPWGRDVFEEDEPTPLETEAEEQSPPVHSPPEVAQVTDAETPPFSSQPESPSRDDDDYLV